MRPGVDFVRHELHLSPLFPVRPWGEAQRRPEEFDQTLKARQIAADHWRKPSEPVLDDDRIREIDRIVRRATDGG